MEHAMFEEYVAEGATRTRLASRLMGGLLVLGCLLAPASAGAQNYPNRALKLIVTSSPGGPTDVLARPIAEKVSEILGQQVVVDNVPGANTMIAAARTARSDPDGYTLFLVSASTVSLNPATRKNLSYSMKDFAPVVLVASSRYVLAARTSLGVSNVSELKELARKNPGRIKYGMSVGSPSHFAGLMLGSAAGVEFMPIPYKDVAQATKDILVGEVDFVFTPLSTVEHLIGQKQGVVILGVTDDERIPQLPNIPTLIEQGYKGVWGGSWYGIVLRSGSPAYAVKRLNEAFNQALEDQSVRERLLRAGFKVYGGTPEQLAKHIENEAPVYKKIAQEANIQLD
ncbi:Tripartite tricarboxylate transporter family receptor [Pigmentiphaga humi]|uniref:Tripartite tricarboxylate transporter family receptor n=1 Tax=Pigmentiphaga humi TaxID=2478468 RepID=A0A3P4AXX4_9BURK|nr:tripartite tricarboxylate transporter substrate binding protein [Pigmentiphaga humi]VCU68903.1 Tripartite tricarboxylate transporter family receptor [Pigmentiphaga humi]